MAFESTNTKMLLSATIPDLGPFQDLSSYISLRWRVVSDSQLPDLPVPDVFQQTFRDWARNKVNLVSSG